MKAQIWNFIKTYKTPIIGVILVWVCVFFLKKYTFDPLRTSNKALKTKIELRDKENAVLNARVHSDSLYIVELDIKIQDLQAREDYYKSLQPIINKKYDNEKADYIGGDLNKRRLQFARLANE